MAKKSRSKFKVLIAGGGTGGHIFSGIAIARDIKDRFADSDILFVGTKHGLEKHLVPSYGFKIKYITVRGLKGKSLLSTFKNTVLLPISLFQSVLIVRRFKPDIVFGVGGYASGPIGYVTGRAGLPLVLIEQNSIPGFTNRKLSKYASFAATGYKMAAKYLDCRVELTGVPLRKEFSKFDVSPGTKKSGTVLILGGSQGARGLNQRIISALPLLKKAGLKIRIIHQTGSHDYEEIRNAYQSAGMDADMTPFIDDIISAYVNASFVISRAGAITLAELKRMGLPALLVPLPGSIYNHQYHNAEEISQAGGAYLVEEKDLSPEKLMSVLEEVFGGDTLRKASKKMASLGFERSTERIVDLAIELLNGNNRSTANGSNGKD